MFDRFSDRARIIIALAMKAAIRYGHDSIRPEHLVLAVADERTGMAITALHNLGATSEMIHIEIEKRLVAEKGTTRDGPLPFSPTTKRVLERASEESRTLGHPYIGTEHIVLGIFTDEACIAASALAALDVSAINFRMEVLDLLGQSADAPSPPATAANPPVILLSNAAKLRIADAVDRIRSDPAMLPALCKTMGITVGTAGDRDHLDYTGTCFVISGYAGVEEGFIPIILFGRDVLIHHADLAELNGKMLDVVTIINTRNGAEAQVMKAFQAP